MTLRAKPLELKALGRIGWQDPLSPTGQRVLKELRLAERRGREQGRTRRYDRKRMLGRRGCPDHPKADIKITLHGRERKYTCATCGKPVRR